MVYTYCIVMSSLTVVVIVEYLSVWLAVTGAATRSKGIKRRILDVTS